MTLPIRCVFFRDSHDRWGRLVSTTWDNLCVRLSRHDQGTKDGPALTCCTFAPDAPRGNDSIMQRTMVAFDIETNRRTGEVPMAFDVVLRAFQVRRVAAVLWTTHSHTPDAPRYRVLMPLETPLDYQGDIDPYLTGAAAAQMQFYGLADPSKFGAASLFYLPRHPPGAAFEQGLSAGDGINAGLLLTMATTIAQNVAQAEAEVLARKRARELPPELMALIKGYNDQHAIAERLVQYGYQRDGMRWRSRYQHGQGATTVLPDGSTWVSFSESDADSGVGNRPAKRSSQCACWGDAFSLYVHYEMSGSFRNALESLRSSNAGH